MIPNWEFEKVVTPDREMGTYEKIFDSEGDTFEEEPESCNLEKVAGK